MKEKKDFDPRDKNNYWHSNDERTDKSKEGGVDLADSEEKAVDAEKQEPSTQSSFEYSPSAGKSRRQQAATNIRKVFSGKKKYGWGIGGIIGVFIGVLVFLAPLIGPLQMFENLEDFHLGPRRDLISRRTVRVIKKIRANAATTPDADPVTKRLADVDIDDLSSELSAKGYSLEIDGNGSPTGVIDTDGTFRSLDNIDEVVDLVDDAVPVGRAANRGYMRNLFTAETGYSWSSILGRADPDASIWSWIRTRARLTDADVDLTKNYTDDELAQSDLADNVDDVGRGSGVAEEAIEVAEAKKLAGASDAEAVKAGTGVLREKVSGKSALMTSLILACTSKAVYDNQLQMRWNNFKSAVATFFDLAIIADEVKHGDVNTARHVGEFMDKYSNDSGSFASSAAWQEVTGQEVTGPGLLPENDVNSSLTSDDFVGSLLGNVAAAGGIVDAVPGLSHFCGLINGILGTVIGGIVANVLDWGAAGIEIAAACTAGAAVSLGGTCALKLGSVGALEIGLPRLFSVILSAFVEKTIDDPAQAFNYLSQAGALVNSESSRTGRPVDNETYAKNDLQPYLQESQAKHSSLYAKWLSPDNPKSMMSQVGQWKTSIVYSDKSFGTFVTTILKVPFSFANFIFNNLTGLSERASAAAGEIGPHDSIQKYSFRTNSLDSDPVVLANEVITMLEEEEGAALSTVLRDTAKYCMGYDYKNDRFDPSLQLPLYSNPGTDASGFFARLGSVLGDSQDAQAKNRIVQDYCVPNSSGELNSGVSLDDYEKLGRFVDDLMIIENMDNYLEAS